MPGPHIEQHLTIAPDPGGTYVDCTFASIHVERADLRSTTFEGCTFTGCTLRLADLTDARLRDCTFIGCDLMGLALSRARWGQFGLGEPLRFLDCRLDYGNLHGLRLDGGVLYGSSLVEADLEDTSLVGADLRHTDLTGARLAGADLSDADLSGAVGYALHPERTRLAGTTLSLPEAAAVLVAIGMVVAPAADRMTPAERLAAT